MELKHSFSVPVDRATAWSTFEDVASVAECFPGAAVTSVEGDQFTGTCKVKLGPVALQYAGTGTFTERDPDAGRLALEAKGRDKRGNGTAGASIVATFTATSSTETHVAVATDLQITGKPAQFGRGVMQDVSDKLLAQFVECLRSRVATPEPAAAEAESQPPAAEAASEPSELSEPSEPSEPSASVAARPQSAGAGEDALDLGSTVLPVLVRTYGPRVAIVVALLVVLRLVRRRRRG